MLFVLSYPRLSDGDQSRVEAFRRAHEPDRAGLVPAHITLVFGLRSRGTGYLLDRVSAAAADLAPFAIRLDRAETYEDRARGEHKIFLIVGRGSRRLTRLHRTLHEGLPITEAGMRFRPHMTIATSTAQEPIESALKEAEQLLPIQGRVDALSVVRLQRGRLEAVAEIAFGRTAPAGTQSRNTA